MTDPLRALTQCEDAARELRNMMKRRDTAVVPSDVERLANAVTQGFQAIRELLQ
jgi:hypothetical protein